MADKQPEHVTVKLTPNQALTIAILAVELGDGLPHSIRIDKLSEKTGVDQAWLRRQTQRLYTRKNVVSPSKKKGVRQLIAPADKLRIEVLAPGPHASEFADFPVEAGKTYPLLDLVEMLVPSQETESKSEPQKSEPEPPESDANVAEKTQAKGPADIEDMEENALLRLRTLSKAYRQQLAATGLLLGDRMPAELLEELQGRRTDATSTEASQEPAEPRQELPVLGLALYEENLFDRDVLLEFIKTGLTEEQKDKLSEALEVWLQPFFERLHKGSPNSPIEEGIKQYRENVARLRDYVVFAVAGVEVVMNLLRESQRTLEEAEGLLAKMSRPMVSSLSNYLSQTKE